MAKTIIDSLYSDYEALISYLDQNAEISHRNTVESYSRKVLLLSSSSYFEHKIRECLLEFATERTNSDTIVLSLIRSKAIERQYHTYFNWEGKNANQFFSLFGDEFKDQMSKFLKTNNDMNQSIRDFLELGYLRNKLVHLDFASFPLDKSLDEIYSLYKNALIFVEIIPSCLRDFGGSASSIHMVDPVPKAE